MDGKKREKNLPETHEHREQKTMEKNRLEKVQKHVLFNHTNIVTKNYSRNTRISRAINDLKKSSGKSAKSRFL